MTELLTKTTGRRAFLGGIGVASGGLLMSGCTTGLGGFGMVDAVRRLLFLSSEQAFARLTAPGGYWDDQVAQIGLGNLLGARGDVLSNILTSALFKSRLEREFAGFALEASDRAAPIVLDTVRTISSRTRSTWCAADPAATSYLRGNMGTRRSTRWCPNWATMRVASDPLVGHHCPVRGRFGGVATRVANGIDDAIWGEIGREEAAIRANPQATRDPLIIGVFGAADRLL